MKGKFAGLVVFVTVLTLIYILLSLHWYSENDNKTVLLVPIIPLVKYTSDNLPNTVKTILYWDTFHGAEDMGIGLGAEIFKHCEINACTTTNNHKLMDIEQFDAIIFHGARYNVQKNGIPQRRHIKQKYIFFSLESAFNTDFEQLINENFYNWTLSFKKTSDLYLPYGVIKPQLTNYTLPINIKEKTKKIAWFASNCYTIGSKIRLNYVRALEKYIPVDIYGDCGTLKCPHSEKCYKMLENNYKFYLSFENSFCEDYVTEKFFNILKYNVIPVTMGHVNYSAISPGNSFIDSANYETPQALAEFLLVLDKNETEYLKYFEWKKNYVVHDARQDMLCNLCKKLHEPLNYSWYKNIKHWYFDNCPNS